MNYFVISVSIMLVFGFKEGFVNDRFRMFFWSWGYMGGGWCVCVCV